MNQLLQETLIATGNVWAGFLVLKSTGTVKGSAISKTHPSLALKQEDLDQFNFAFKDPWEIRNRGLALGGKVYQCIRADDASVYAKSSEGSGWVVAKTKQFYLISAFSEEMQPAVAVEATESLADYFRQKGR